jgi:anti-anti-sigma regulatory factor
MLDDKREDATGAIVLSLSGALNTAAADALLSAVTQVPDPVAVVLDLSRVHEFHDSAMGILARQLVSRAGPVAFRGLRHHQERVLNYLGMKADESGLH